MWIVYLIQNSISFERYIGFTSDLRERIKEHNSGRNVSTRRIRGKWVLIYAEAYKSEIDARRREQSLKSHGSAKHELFKRLSNSMLEHKTGAGRS